MTERNTAHRNNNRSTDSCFAGATTTVVLVKAYAGDNWRNKKVAFLRNLLIVKLNHNNS